MCIFFNNTTEALVNITDGTVAYNHTFCQGEKINVVIFDSASSQLNEPAEITLIENETPVNFASTCFNTAGAPFRSFTYREPGRNGCCGNVCL